MSSIPTKLILSRKAPIRWMVTDISKMIPYICWSLSMETISKRTALWCWIFSQARFYLRFLSWRDQAIPHSVSETTIFSVSMMITRRLNAMRCRFIGIVKTRSTGSVCTRGECWSFGSNWTARCKWLHSRFSTYYCNVFLPRRIYGVSLINQREQYIFTTFRLFFYEILISMWCHLK